MSEPRVDSLSVELRGLISEDGFCMNGLHIFFHLLQRDHLTSLRLFVIFMCNRRLMIQISSLRVWKFKIISKALAYDFLSLCFHLILPRFLENGSWPYPFSFSESLVIFLY